MYSVVLMAALTTGASAPDWCHGCWGGRGCQGCWSCYGGCHGCWGCYGGGGSGGGCWGCYSGCYAGCWACYGGGGGGGGTYYWGCYGGCHGCHAMSYAPAGGTMPPAPPEMPPAKKDGMALQDKAKLIVEVPSDARLYIDEQLTKASSERRVFNTPTLDKGQTYYYVVRAEVVRDGKTHSETKRVLVRAGEEIRASFPELETAALAARLSTAAGR